MIDSDYIQQAYYKWTSMLDKKRKAEKVISIDRKTMRGNTQNCLNPNHIVTAWSRKDGYRLGQSAVDEKSNEIKTIHELLNKINIINLVVTLDTMGTQTTIAEKIKIIKGDHILNVWLFLLAPLNTLIICFLSNWLQNGYNISALY